MNLHYGPEWFWDQTRPEALEALRQMKEFQKGCHAFQLTSQANSARTGISGNSRAKHFPKAFWHSFRIGILAALRPKIRPNFGND
jgi:hypothetical protein